ncbi:MAG: hypothetical protein ACYTEX_26980 [Planctomycetota bacterium]|jgi:hypothetical protein
MTMRPIPPDSAREGAEINELQQLWGEFVTWVLHDTAFHLFYVSARRKRPDGEIETFLDESALRRARQQVTADTQLLWYVASSATSVPMERWSARTLLTTMRSLITGSSDTFHYGYDFRLGDQIESLRVECKAFVVNAILAAMLFRIPSGSSEEPVILVASACGGPEDNNIGTIQFRIETVCPPTEAQLVDLQLETDGRGWDPWHHSWIFAFDWAAKYGGQCSARVTSDKRLSVGLELPLLVGV